MPPALQYEMHSLEAQELHHRKSLSQPLPEAHIDEDTLALARSGKKQLLKRRFGTVSIVGFACTLMSTWEGILTTFLLGYQNGGPAGLLYGFFVAWVGTVCVFLSLGELNSMIPTAGGQYHYVYVLAPPGCRKFFSYLTGWMTLLGWIAATAAASFFASSMIQGLVVLCNPSYSLIGWQGTLIYWAIVLLALSINTVFSKLLPSIEVTILFVHILGFFAIIIPLARLAPHTDSSEIWGSFLDSGWNSTGLALFIGLKGVAAPFVGTDGAIHMSEEIKGATKTVPRAMFYSIIINGILGFGILLAVLYCQGDLASAALTPTGYPFIAIFARGVQSIGGATAMVSLVVFMGFCNAIGALASTSRMLWSFARDNGLPFSSRLSKIQSRSLLPMTAIFVTTICVALLGVINIGSTVAFENIISLTLEGFYTSYFIALCLLLWRRLRGDVAEETNPTEIRQEAKMLEKQLRWGPWRLKRHLGVFINVIGCLYLLIMIFFCFWPATLPVTPMTMDYSSLIWGIVVLASVFYYLIWASRFYKGPVVEVTISVA